jgi:hypothetical protein
MRRVAFFVAGLVLFSLPFLTVGVGIGHHPEPHADHAPRHGGLLLMVGDHHLEVVERDETIEVYPSDARRRPIEPASGRVAFDETGSRTLEWKAGRLVAAGVSDWRTAAFEITLANGEVLSIQVPRVDG